jgi:hypothetical protein
VRAGLLAEVAARGLALAAEEVIIRLRLHTGTAGFALRELGHGEVPPRVSARSSPISAAQAVGELAQEPVDRIDVISRTAPRPLEPGVVDQRPSKTTGVKLGRGLAKQLVHLCRGVTPRVMEQRRERVIHAEA